MGKKHVRTLSDGQVKKLGELFAKRLSAIQKDGSAPTALTYENIGKAAKCTPLTAKRHWDKFLADQGLRSKFGKVQKMKGAKVEGGSKSEAPPKHMTQPAAPTGNHGQMDGNFKAWLQLGTGSGYVAKLIEELERRINTALHGE